jgi:hypothetical protein
MQNCHWVIRRAFNPAQCQLDDDDYNTLFCQECNRKPVPAAVEAFKGCQHSFTSPQFYVFKCSKCNLLVHTTEGQDKVCGMCAKNHNSCKCSDYFYEFDDIHGRSRRIAIMKEFFRDFFKKEDLPELFKAFSTAKDDK